MANCYWHKKLDEPSSELCTFNTPYGRYKFNLMPFAISCASDAAQEMIELNFGDIPNVLAIHDDLIIAAKTDTEHDKIFQQILQRARERNIKFSLKKNTISKNSVIPDKTAFSVIKFMKTIFTRHGIPSSLIANNNPYNNAEFLNFSKEYGFNFTPSSPNYPQSNGLSEMGVKIMKKILKKMRQP
nr:uncharacterized protein K02A2.6-like [Hydra vulgaris]